jgi:hypothetical protein
MIENDPCHRISNFVTQIWVNITFFQRRQVLLPHAHCFPGQYKGARGPPEFPNIHLPVELHQPLLHVLMVDSQVVQSVAVVNGFVHLQYSEPHTHDAFSGVAGQLAGFSGPLLPP